MRDLLLLAIHLFVTIVKLLRPGGVRAITAESLFVPPAPKLTTHADCTLTSVCRLAAVVNRRSAQFVETDRIRSGGNSCAQYG